MSKFTTENFISRARIVHGDKYNYSKSIYATASSKLIIICREHGEFTQTPHGHLGGKGCVKCGGKKVFDTNSFISKAIEVHGERYDYSRSEYKNAKAEILIICKDHGPFMQEPIGHISGRGCPSCAKYGFDKSKNGFVYFLHGDGFIKVGITNKPSQRIKQLKSATPFHFNLIAKVKTTGAEAMRIEKYYHKKYESAGLTGFDGATEWLKYSPELMSEIMNENTTI